MESEMSEINEMYRKRKIVDHICSTIDPKLHANGDGFFTDEPEKYHSLLKERKPFHYYLKTLLQRRNETSVRRYVEAFVDSLWKEYDDIVDQVTKHIVKGCLAVELFRRFKMKHLRKDDDPVLGDVEALNQIRFDLLRSSPPFESLLLLFDLSKNEADPQDSLIELALHFFECMIGHCNLKPVHISKIHAMRHGNLLDLVCNALCPQILDDGVVSQRNSDPENVEEDLQFINYATELQEAGIKFKKWKGDTILDIKFENGVMKIPALKVSRTTLKVLRHLIEHEARFRCGPSDQRCVTDYVKFLKCLVNSPKDVELLRRNGIIENWLGSDELIFEDLSGLDRTICDMHRQPQMSKSFTYSQVLINVNCHCKHRRSVWMAKLWNNYFNSPWSLISFIAATVLLLLTIIQTVYSVLSYYHPKH
ncbi:hypothetical protein NMG60_11031837 [Bertholletia excelsa]